VLWSQRLSTSEDQDDLKKHLAQLTDRVKRLEVRVTLNAGRLFQLDNILEHSKRILLGLWDWATTYAGFLKIEPPKTVPRTAGDPLTSEQVASLRTQHVELLRTADDIVYLIKDCGEFPVQEVFEKLQLMVARVDTHFLLEDTMLQNIDHEETVVQQMVNSHASETKGMRRIFHAYHSRWFTPSRIAADRMRFVMETIEVFDMLFHRIESEDKIIYPHLEDENG
jgi:hypothetical protein